MKQPSWEVLWLNLESYRDVSFTKALRAPLSPGSPWSDGCWDGQLSHIGIYIYMISVCMCTYAFHGSELALGIYDFTKFEHMY